MKVCWDYYSQYMEKNAKCSKPPTSFKWFKYKRENEKFLTFGRDLATLWGVISRVPPAIATAARKKCEAGAKELWPMDLGALSAHIFQWIGRKFQTGNPETRDFTQTLSRRFPMISSIYVLFNQFWEICSGYMWLSPWESGTETSKSCMNFDAAPMGRWQVETTS